MQTQDVLTLQLRLKDQLGDNGVIGVVIARPTEPGGKDMLIETWLMSCRVLGRQVEEATLNLVVARAALSGACRLIGEHRPTPRNQMVRDHYQKLGFDKISEDASGVTIWQLSIADFVPLTTFIETVDRSE